MASQDTQSMWPHADTVVVGGGPAGCTVAAGLAEETGGTVALLEAGPDYGPLGSGRWPRELLDASAIPTTHGWGYDSGNQYPGRIVEFPRAKVIGGCSSHNSCLMNWGYRGDYDGWAANGMTGWSTADILPFLRHATDKLRVRTYTADEVGPFHQACLDAAAAAGIPPAKDLNDLDEHQGIGLYTVNERDGIRFNAAFAFLDPLRDRPEVGIWGDTLVERLERGGSGWRVTGLHGDRSFVMHADRVVLCAGTYESPCILLRSGVGNPDELRRLGIAPVLDLPGVGENLHDHPLTQASFSGTEELMSRLRTAAIDRFVPEEQTLIKMASSLCGEGYDLHLIPFAAFHPDSRFRGQVAIGVSCLNPLSRGRLRLASADVGALPILEHRYLTDPAGHDLAVLVEGVSLALDLARAEPLRSLLGTYLGPGPAKHTRLMLEDAIRADVSHYYHPVGTCAMGPADGTSVVDTNGAVHGLEGVFVADCSIAPWVPRANTTLTATVIGQRIASFLVGNSR